MISSCTIINGGVSAVAVSTGALCKSFLWPPRLLSTLLSAVGDRYFIPVIVMLFMGMLNLWSRWRLSFRSDHVENGEWIVISKKLKRRLHSHKWRFICSVLGNIYFHQGKYCLKSNYGKINYDRFSFAKDTQQPRSCRMIKQNRR